MNYLGLSNNSNDYMLDKRKQIKFCFTVKHKKYALALVNTLKRAKFESYKNFDIYCCDDESKNVMDKYGIPYMDSYGIDVYNDKILNAMRTSIKNPNNIVVALDAILVFDFHTYRGALGRLEKIDNNTIYYMTYEQAFLEDNKKTMYNVYAGIMLYYNIKPYMLNRYLFCMKHSKSKIIYNVDESVKRYNAETKVTEENVLSQHKRLLHLKPFTMTMFVKTVRFVTICWGGNTLNRMIENHWTSYRDYILDEDILGEFYVKT